jgi:hypothetical protein
MDKVSAAVLSIENGRELVNATTKLETFGESCSSTVHLVSLLRAANEEELRHKVRVISTRTHDHLSLRLQPGGDFLA